MRSLTNNWLITIMCFCFIQKAGAQCLSFFPSANYDCLTLSAYTGYTVYGTGLAPYTCTFVNSSGQVVATGSTSSTTGTVVNLPQGTYSVYMSSANGCTASSIPYVVVIPYTVANAVFNTTSVTCNGGSNGGASVTLPLSFNSTPPPSYTWTPGPYYTSFVSNLSANIVYSVTIKDSKGCVVTNTVSINEPPPIASTLTNTFIPCFGKTLNTTITSTGNVGATTYTVNGTPAVSNNAVITAPGTTTIITKDSKGCIKTNTVFVDQQAQPLISFNIIKPSCPGKPDGTITSGVSNAPAAYNYTWQPGGANTANLSNIPTGTYTLSVLDGNGCLTQSATVVLPAANVTVAAITKPENCSAADGAFTLNITGANAPFTFTTLPFGPHPTNTLSNLASGSYTSLVSYNNNCIDTTIFNIGNLSPVSLSVLNSVPIKCYNNCTGSLSVGAQNATQPVTYSITGFPTTTVNVFSNLCAGFYVIQATDASGCPATTTISFAQPPIFSYTATASAQVCSGQQVSLQGLASGGSGGYTYVWNPGSIQGQLVNITPSGTTVYSLNAYDSNGCTLAPDQVTVNVLPPISININSSNAGICPGTTAQITPTISGGDGNYTYLWQPGNITSPSVFLESITTPVYTLSVSDGCGSAPATKYISINLFSVNKPSFKIKSKKGCEPFCTQFFNTTAKSRNAVWNYGDRPFEQAGDTTTYCYQKAGTYDLSLSLIDSNSCKTSFTYTNVVEVLAKPEADFISSPVRITLKSAEHVLIKNITAGGSFYQWLVSDQSQGETEDIYFSFPDTGCYKVTLIARNLNNCVDTAEKYLCVVEDFNFFMPTCFTPNGNNLNDTLLPKGTGWLKKNYVFEIYNRWGTRIFKTNELASGWDGSNSDKDTPYNSYIWRVKITDIQEIEHVMQGPVTVLR